MNANGLKILIVEAGSSFGHALGRCAASGALPFHPNIRTAQSVQEAFDEADAEQPDLVFLALDLPGGGLEALGKIREKIPAAPVVAIVPSESDAIGLETVQHGAQDYLAKTEENPAVISRVVRHAMERFRMQELIRDLLVNDPVTGLLNRKGFNTLAEHHLKFARRETRLMLLFYMDIDGLKQLNESHGIAAGDKAILAAAKTLRICVRDSDVLARLQGDEFIALLTTYTDGLDDLFRRRVDDVSTSVGTKDGLPTPLRISCGHILVRPSERLPMQDLIQKAEQDLRIRKQERRRLARHTHTS